jgi:hypothetical protein
MVGPLPCVSSDTQSMPRCKYDTAGSGCKWKRFNLTSATMRVPRQIPLYRSCKHPYSMWVEKDNTRCETQQYSSNYNSCQESHSRGTAWKSNDLWAFKPSSTDIRVTALPVWGIFSHKWHSYFLLASCTSRDQVIMTTRTSILQKISMYRLVQNE